MKLLIKIEEKDFRTIDLAAQKQKDCIKGILDNAGRGNVFMMLFFIRELIESLLNFQEEYSFHRLPIIFIICSISLNIQKPQATKARVTTVNRKSLSLLVLLNLFQASIRSFSHFFIDSPL